MMTSLECADIWREVVQIYNETRGKTPKETMNKIVRIFGLVKTKEVFATVAAIKKHDGRIYGTNREYVNNIPTNPECIEHVSENHMIYAGLDEIHTSHIDQLITELRNIELYMNTLTE